MGHLDSEVRTYSKSILTIQRIRPTLKKIMVCSAPTYPPKTGPTQNILLPF